MESDISPNPLESIVFISLPEKLDKNIGGFIIDPAILIPVELLQGQDRWEVEDQSFWENTGKKGSSSRAQSTPFQAPTKSLPLWRIL